MTISGIHQDSAPDAVAARAALRPDDIALTSGARFLTYRELDAQANRLARDLRRRGVAADVPVGLCLPRSLDLAVAALGILKAGGAYVPLDPAYPTERLAFMLRDSEAPVLITDSSLASRFENVNCAIADIGAPEIAQGPDRAPDVLVEAGDLAYIIYTSGSTGEPKGVEITHAGLANLVHWHCEAFEVAPEDRASHLAGLGFDASVWELWPYLAAGATVCFVDEVTRTSPDLLRDWLIGQSITISFVPTPLAERMLALDWPTKTPLRVLLTGGDALHHHPRASLPFDVVNNYGPTEAAVVATSGRLAPNPHAETLPSIGSEIANTRIYLLNGRMEAVADGQPGEMHIAGPGVARGYRHRPDLTAQKFVANPFDEGRLYKTGDLARRLSDGQIEFLGRIDDQIKLRGYRIDPLEIVAALNRHPEVRDAIVIAREDGAQEDADAGKRLVAYLILDENSALTHTALREFLRDRLPEYMLPSVFVTVPSFPTTANGKVNYAAVPAPEAATTLHDDIAAPPSTPLERDIAGIVAGLLGLEQVGTGDNFFLLGGHSLLGAQLIARLRDRFGVEIHLRTLFESPTVAALAAHIESHGETHHESPDETSRASTCASTRS